MARFLQLLTLAAVALDSSITFAYVHLPLCQFSTVTLKSQQPLRTTSTLTKSLRMVTYQYLHSYFILSGGNSIVLTAYEISLIPGRIWETI